MWLGRLLLLLALALQGHGDESAIEQEIEMAGLEIEEGNHEVKSKDLTAAVFLLGGVTFVMSLFYLVNHPDMDIREHTWKVINATVSIFVSVLLFQGVTGVSDAISDTYLINQSHQFSAKIGFAYFMFMIFYCSLHIVLFNLAYSSESTHSTLTRSSKSVLAALEHGSWEQRRKRQIACWATLLSHMAGFAHIRCSLDLQQLPIFKDGWMIVWPTVLNALMLIGVFKISDSIRSRFLPSSEQDQEGFILWEEGAKEAEDDIATIGISFSAIVVIRFLLTHQMANPLGLELPVRDHAMYAKISIGSAALVFALISIIILMINTRIEKKKGAHKLVRSDSMSASEHRMPYTTRWVFIASSTFATAASWCGLYGAKWFLFGFESERDATANPNSCISRVICALLVSFGSFVLIYFLDKLKDMDETGESADRAIVEVIHAVGVSVGFAWEQAFDAGVETIGELTMHHGSWYPVWARLAFALMISGVMIPAWRLYLIKKSLEAHEKCSNCGAVLVIDAHHCHMCATARYADGESARTPKAR